MLEQCVHLTGKEDSGEVEVMANARCSPWISVLKMLLRLLHLTSKLPFSFAHKAGRWALEVIAS